MGDNTGSMGDNSWAQGDFDSSIAPYATGGGVYDFSGTVADPFYYQMEGTNITKEDLETYKASFWDGSSSAWTSDDEYGELAKTGHKLTGNGLSCIMMGRNAFGDGDCQHIVTARKGKKGIVMAHCDFTLLVGFFDEEAGMPAGNLKMAMQALAESYKEQGY